MSWLQYLLKHIKDTDDAYLVNAQDRYGNSPLHQAARVGNLNIAKVRVGNFNIAKVRVGSRLANVFTSSICV